MAPIQKKMVRVLSCDVLDHMHGAVSAEEIVLASRFKNLSMNSKWPVPKRQKVQPNNQTSSQTAEAGDMEDSVLRAFAPDNCTITSSLVLAASKIDKFRGDFEKAKEEAKHFAFKSNQDVKALVSDMWDRFAVKLGVRMLRKLSDKQRISVEVHAELSTDVDSSVAKAHQILYLYAVHGFPKERVQLKFASSWESVQACKALQEEGIKCTFVGHSSISSNGAKQSMLNKAEMVAEKSNEITVSAEIDACFCSDAETAVAKAREMLSSFAAEGVDKKHVLLKLVSSWEGVQACKTLKAEGIRCTYMGHSRSFQDESDDDAMEVEKQTDASWRWSA
jgi:transaldolase